MAREIEALRYMIDAVWDGDRAVGRAKQQIGELGDSTERVVQRSKTNWKAIGTAVVGAGAAITAIGVAATKAYRMINEGADLLRAEDQFERLAGSINAAADSMMGSLRTATKGMIADAELMRSATQIMNLGLQDTEEGVVRLAAVAGQLGWDMNQVILTMANNSVMRLDALGLSIDDVKSKAAALEKQGMSMDAAFDMAVIQAGEEKLALLGDASLTTAGKLDRLEAHWSNFVTSVKIGVAEAIVPAIDAVDRLANAAANPIQFQFEISATAGTGQGFEAWLAQSVASGAQIPGDYQTQQAWYRDAVARQRGIYQMASRDANIRPRGSISSQPLFDYQSLPDPNGNLRVQTAEERRLLQLRNEGGRIMADYATRGLETAHAMEAQTEALRGGGGRGGGGLINALRDSAEAMSQLSAESGDLFSRLRGAKEFNLAEELFSLGDKMGAGALDLAQFGVTAGLFDQARADELLGQSFLLQNAKQMLDQGMSLQEVWAAVSGQQENAATLAQEFFSTVDQTSAEATMLLDTEPSYSELDAFISAVETANPVMNIATNFGGYGAPPASSGRSGGAPVQTSGATGGGGASPMTVNINNREAAAMFLTNTGLARRAGLDQRMGVA